MEDQDREKIMQQWDMYRQLIADGHTSSLPRDWFESILDRAYEAEATIALIYELLDVTDTALQKARSEASTAYTQIIVKS